MRGVNRLSAGLLFACVCVTFLWSRLGSGKPATGLTERDDNMEESTAKAFKEAKIIPDVIDAVADDVPMTVNYGFGALENGVDIPPNKATKAPKIVIGGDEDTMYSLLMVDPDPPSPADPKFREWLHWIVTNIPGGKFADGDAVVEYNGPTPPRGTHRYVFMLFEQNAEIDVTAPESRAKFKTREFAEKHDLQGPVAGVYFLSTSA